MVEAQSSRGARLCRGAWLHGKSPERHWVAETRRALLWGAALPLGILLAVVPSPPLAALLTLAYPAQLGRLAGRIGMKRAAFSMLGKTAEALGVIEFHINRLRGRGRGLIEYK